MSAQATPVENAVSERFHRTIKNIVLENTFPEKPNKTLVDGASDIGRTVQSSVEKFFVIIFREQVILASNYLSKGPPL